MAFSAPSLFPVDSRSGNLVSLQTPLSPNSNLLKLGQLLLSAMSDEAMKLQLQPVNDEGLPWVILFNRSNLTVSKIDIGQLSKQPQPNRNLALTMPRSVG